MKLRAGLCFLKLANARVYDKAMSWELFETVASVCQVCFVRVQAFQARSSCGRRSASIVMGGSS